jgi:hypothetical protein
MLSIPWLTNRSRAAGPPMEPLPKLTYSFLKDNKLRQKLRELGISDSGSRKLLEERHAEWITIWNANLDSAHPKSKSELLVDLNTWERAHTRMANNRTKSADWSDNNWAAQHKDNFSSLIEQARANAKRRKVENGETNQDQDSLRKETASAPPSAPTPSLAEPVVTPSSQPSPITHTRPGSHQSRLPFSSQPALNSYQGEIPPSSQPAPAWYQGEIPPSSQPAPALYQGEIPPSSQPAPAFDPDRPFSSQPVPVDDWSSTFPINISRPSPPNNADAWRVLLGQDTTPLPPIGRQYAGAQSLPPIQLPGAMPPQYPANLPPVSSLPPPSSQQDAGLRFVQWQPEPQPQPQPQPQPYQPPSPASDTAAAMPTTSDKRKYDSIE